MPLSPLSHVGNSGVQTLSIFSRRAEAAPTAPADADVRRLEAVYLIGCLRLGGAQTGLLRLVDFGFLNPRATHLVSLGPACPNLLGELLARGPWGGLTIVRRGPAPARWVAGAVVLAGLLARSRPQLVILSLEPSNLIGRLLAILFRRIRFLSFEHSSRYRRWIYRAFLPILSGRIEVVLHDSKATRLGVERYYRGDRTVWLEVPLFVAKPGRAVKAHYDIGSSLRLLSVGRLVPAKDHALLLDVVAELNRRGVRVHCELVGEGPLRGILELRRTALGLDRAFVFKGEDPDWQDRAAEFDIYVQTSEQEGAALTVLEAMEVGLPVVATAVGEIRRYLADGAGIALSTRCPREIADVIEQLAGDTDGRARLGRRASARIREQFDESAIGASLLEIRRRLSLGGPVSLVGS